MDKDQVLKECGDVEYIFHLEAIAGRALETC